jgi:hypothetical protein
VFVLKGCTFSGLDTLPSDVGEHLYAELLKYGSACGCSEGAICALLSGTLYALWIHFQSLLPGEPVEGAWWMGLLVAVAGSIVGKCFGLWRADRRFENLRHEVTVLTHQRSPTNAAVA